MRRLAADWCLAKQVSGLRVRLDAIAVLISGGQVHIEHLKEVF
jgi:putative endonuclease